jgi:hypothetical protein
MAACLTNFAPREIRTPGLLVRSQTLYPAELWVRNEAGGYDKLLHAKRILTLKEQNYKQKLAKTATIT